MADDVVGLMDYLKIDKAALVGGATARSSASTSLCAIPNG